MPDQAPNIDIKSGGGRLVYDKERRAIVAEPKNDSWKCCGCGKPSPGRFRICDCLTTCVSDDAGKRAWKIDPIPHKLAETIRTKLLGVPPEDQDVVLEDADWRVILAALEIAR